MNRGSSNIFSEFMGNFSSGLNFLGHCGNVAIKNNEFIYQKYQLIDSIISINTKTVFQLKTKQLGILQKFRTWLNKNS